LEIDIERFFDTLDRRHLQEILRQRVQDGVLLRLIGKWLNAGVQEDGCVTHPDAGSPQGGVISPVLSNVYLHEVLDVWFERQVRPRLRGRASLIRYADDAVLVFSDEDDARRVLEVLPKRFGRYGLALHPEKTRLVRFERPRRPPPPGGPDVAPPETFDLLGFTHLWARSRSGSWVVKQFTATGRFSRALHRIRDWCRTFRHLPMREQLQALSQKLRGHFAYYGITGNSGAIARFAHEVKRAWRLWLGRRSNGNPMTWDRFNGFLSRHPLPAPVIVRRHVANP
jgi:group II intron reverse transcriptase/maturase